MQITKIDSNSHNKALKPSFKSLSLTSKGAYKLAGYFVENPGFEDIFMKQIALPIHNSKTKVLFSDSVIRFLTPIKEGVYSVLKKYSKDSTPYALVHAYTGPEAGSRIPFYLEALKNPTNNFKNLGHIFDEFETIKNIAEDAELVLQGYNCKNKQSISRANDILFEKTLKVPGELVENGNNYYISYDKYTQKAEELMKQFPEI